MFNLKRELWAIIVQNHSIIILLLFIIILLLFIIICLNIKEKDVLSVFENIPTLIKPASNRAENQLRETQI